MFAASFTVPATLRRAAQSATVQRTLYSNFNPQSHLDPSNPLCASSACLARPSSSRRRRPWLPWCSYSTARARGRRERENRFSLSLSLHPSLLPPHSLPPFPLQRSSGTGREGGSREGPAHPPEKAAPASPDLPFNDVILGPREMRRAVDDVIGLQTRPSPAVKRVQSSPPARLFTWGPPGDSLPVPTIVDANFVVPLLMPTSLLTL